MRTFSLSQEDDITLLQYHNISKMDVIVTHLLKKVFYNVNNQDGKPSYSKTFDELKDYEWDDLPTYWWIRILLHNPDYTDKCNIWDKFSKLERNILLKYRSDLQNKFINN
jgi:hypothetical protein